MSDIPALNLETDVALDAPKLDEVANLARLAASYWQSVGLACDRGNKLSPASIAGAALSEREVIGIAV